MSAKISRIYCKWLKKIEIFKALKKCIFALIITNESKIFLNVLEIVILYKTLYHTYDKRLFELSLKIVLRYLQNVKVK